MTEKNKIRNIRSLIARPIFLLISLSSIMIFILINGVLVYALDGGMLNSLNTAAVAFHQLNKYNPSATLETNADLFLYSYSQAELSRYTMHLIIADKGNDVTKTSDGLPLEKATQIVAAALKTPTYSTAQLEDAQRIHLNSGERYYIIKSPASIYGKQVFLVAESNIFKNVLVSANKGLITILFCVNILLLLITFYIAIRVTAPLQKLSAHAKQVGNGILVPITIDSRCKELNDLEVSINEMIKHLLAYKTAQTFSLQNLSHQLRTPLMSIQGYAEGLKMGYFEVDSEAPDIIIDESKKLSSIVDQILILSRLDTFAQPVDILPMSLNGFLKAQIKALNGYAFKQNIALVFDDSGEDVLVMADSNLLYNIFVNILSNGIRHAKQEILIDISSTDAMGTFIIRDDGVGLSDEDLEHLFDRFYKGKQGNFGLGLSIAKSAVEYMGGSIVATNSSTGAVFSVSLPLA